MADRNSKKSAPQDTLVLADPNRTKGALKSLGGSSSDDWNNVLANQVVRSLWLAHSDEEDRQRQMQAAAGALVGIGPKDEIEGMLAGQMIAAHSAAMECYRRAMIQDQTFEGRNQSLKFAAKLSSTVAQLQAALDKHRGKGQQKVTVEHVHVNEGGQAIVGSVDRTGGG